LVNPSRPVAGISLNINSSSYRTVNRILKLAQTLWISGSPGSIEDHYLPQNPDFVGKEEKSAIGAPSQTFSSRYLLFRNNVSANVSTLIPGEEAFSFPYSPLLLLILLPDREPNITAFKRIGSEMASGGFCARRNCPPRRSLELSQVHTYGLLPIGFIGIGSRKGKWR